MTTNTHFQFFSGKGGVGKTSMACTTAVREAGRGKRTLIVTTDPASNLADVFEQSIGHKVTPVRGVSNLWAMEIDPDQATREYIDRAMSPIRGAFPAEIVAVMEEQMSGPCTAEVAAFDRFVDFIATPQAQAPGFASTSVTPTSDVPTHFDTVIFDTAPTGHTIRLLELPAEWTRSIDEASAGSGQTCIGPAAAIQDARHKYERALVTMRDAVQTSFVFVLQPEATSIKETQRAIGELEKLGIRTQRLIVNGIIPVEEQANALFAERRRMQQSYLAEIKRDLHLPELHMYLLDGEIKGVARLREVAHLLFEGHRQHSTMSSTESRAPQSISATTTPMGKISPAALACVLPAEPAHHTRSIFFTGKGGVGKTAVSCITAVWLARQGYKTLLLTTDPAAHVGDVLGVPVTDEPAPVHGVPNLWATKIDPKAAGEAYKTRILDDARRRGRPEASIKVMQEELDSPCTEEMAAFDKFIEYAAGDEWQVTVFDTAPTGHTLRLLQLPVEWSKQLDITTYGSVDTVAADDVAKERFGRVIAMMQDPEQSTVAYVMYPESTPIVEAYRASEELRTIGIEPGLVVANQVLPAEACTTPFSQARWNMQQRYMLEIGERFAVPMLLIPLLPREIKGVGLLTELGEQIYGPALAVEAAPVAAGR
ncbi:MAG: TRC40/GET3/ArsA family transport-energizing ATPase [Chloroflexota bacterium]